ncbi:MAG: hypothetical protein LBL61_06365 [Elusimicrobiota bacterium]|nr:hypothetical protein [Elusimicrobiota bacterium]
MVSTGQSFAQVFGNPPALERPQASNELKEQFDAMIAKAFEESTGGLSGIWDKPVKTGADAEARAKEIKDIVLQKDRPSEGENGKPNGQDSQNISERDFAKQRTNEINKIIKNRLKEIAGKKAAYSADIRIDNLLLDMMSLDAWEQENKNNLEKFKQESLAEIPAIYADYEKYYAAVEAEKEKLLEQYIRALAGNIAALAKNYSDSNSEIKSILFEIAPALHSLRTKDKEIFSAEEREFIRQTARETIARSNACDTVVVNVKIYYEDVPGRYGEYTRRKFQTKEYGARDEFGCDQTLKAIIALGVFGSVKAETIPGPPQKAAPQQQHKPNSYGLNPYVAAQDNTRAAQRQYHVIQDNRSDARVILDYVKKYGNTGLASSSLLTGASALLAMDAHDIFFAYIREQIEKEEKNRDTGWIDEAFGKGIIKYLGEVSQYGSYKAADDEVRNAWEDLAGIIADDAQTSEKSAAFLKSILKNVTYGGNNFDLHTINPLGVGALLTCKSGFKNWKPDVPVEGREYFHPDGHIYPYSKYEVRSMQSNADSFNNLMIKNGRFKDARYYSQEAGLAKYLFDSSMNDIDAPAKFSLDGRLYKFYEKQGGNTDSFKMYAKGDAAYNKLQSSRDWIFAAKIFVNVYDIAMLVWFFWDITRWGISSVRIFSAIRSAAKMARAGATVAQRAGMLRGLAKGKTALKLIKMRYRAKGFKFSAAVSAANMGVKNPVIITETGNIVHEFRTVPAITAPKVILRALKPATTAGRIAYPAARLYQEARASLTGRDVYAMNPEKLVKINRVTDKFISFGGKGFAGGIEREENTIYTAGRIGQWRKTLRQKALYGLTGRDVYAGAGAAGGAAGGALAEGLQFTLGQKRKFKATLALNYGATTTAMFGAIDKTYGDDMSLFTKLLLSNAIPGLGSLITPFFTKITGRIGPYRMLKFSFILGAASCVPAFIMGFNGFSVPGKNIWILGATGALGGVANTFTKASGNTLIKYIDKRGTMLNSSLVYKNIFTAGIFGLTIPLNRVFGRREENHINAFFNYSAMIPISIAGWKLLKSLKVLANVDKAFAAAAAAEGAIPLSKFIFSGFTSVKKYGEGPLLFSSAGSMALDVAMVSTFVNKQLNDIYIDKDKLGWPKDIGLAAAATTMIIGNILARQAYSPLIRLFGGMNKTASYYKFLRLNALTSGGSLYLLSTSEGNDWRFYLGGTLAIWSFAVNYSLFSDLMKLRLSNMASTAGNAAKALELTNAANSVQFRLLPVSFGGTMTFVGVGLYGDHAKSRYSEHDVKANRHLREGMGKYGWPLFASMAAPLVLTGKSAAAMLGYTLPLLRGGNALYLGRGLLKGDLFMNPFNINKYNELPTYAQPSSLWGRKFNANMPALPAAKAPAADTEAAASGGAVE